MSLLSVTGKKDIIISLKAKKDSLTFNLLSIKVKRAKYIGDQAAQFSTYVTLKLQNVKTTTLTVKGADPVWDQDFLL